MLVPLRVVYPVLAVPRAHIDRGVILKAPLRCKPKLRLRHRPRPPFAPTLLSPLLSIRPCVQQQVPLAAPFNTPTGRTRYILV